MPATRTDLPHLRPILLRDPALKRRGERLGGGWLQFNEIEAMGSDGCAEVVPVLAAPALFPGAETVLSRLLAPRRGIGGTALCRPVVIARGAIGATAAMAWPDEPEAHPDIPLIAPTATPGEAQALGAAVWLPPDWRSVEAHGLHPGLLLLTPPPTPFTDATAMRRGYDALAQRLQTLEQAGLPRDRVIVALGAPALALFGMLGLMQGLGCALLVDVDGDGRHTAPVSAAAAIVAAAQGIPFLATRHAETVAAAVDGWLDATGGG